MSKLLNRAVRPLAALAIVGAVAAVAAFALLALPQDKPAEAQGAAVITTETALNSITVKATGVTALNTTTNFIHVAITGYTATDTSPSSVNKACTVVATDGSGNNIAGGAPAGTEFGCKTNGDDLAVYVEVLGSLLGATSGPGTIELAITGVTAGSTTAAPAIVTGGVTVQGAQTIGYGTLPFTPGTPAAIGAATNYYRPGTTADSGTVDSTTSSASVQVRLNIVRLPEDLEAGSSIVLYLEDDYVVPNSIGVRSVWFTVSGVPEIGKTNEVDAGRHYPGDPIDVDTDDYFGGDDDYSLRVYIPDMYVGDVAGTSLGFQHPVAGQTLTLTFHSNAGIKNPPEAGTHSIGYSILGPNDSVGDPEVTLATAATAAKISLSDDDDARGKVVTVTGSGFNNGVSASVYMKNYAQSAETADPTVGRWTAPAASAAAAARGTLSRSGDPNAAVADAAAVTAIKRVDSTSTIAAGDVMSPAETCIDIIATGTQLGDGAIVGADDRVEVEFTVANPPFRPGKNNLLCMADGENTRSTGPVSGNTGHRVTGDVEHFNLDPSINVTPQTVNAGDQVTINALDFPSGAVFQWLEVVGLRVTASGTPVGDNGKGSATFNMPGNIKGTVKVEACWGTSDSCDNESTKITVVPSQLSVSKTEVRPNESVIIRGSGFSTASGDGNDLRSAKIDEADLLLTSDGGTLSDVEVSNSGQFSATFAIWASDSNNPALEPGEHTITIEDVAGYSGSVKVTVLAPTLMISPDVAGPRDYVVISGKNWPVENDDGGNISDISIVVSGGGITDDEENEDTDANGNWSFRYRIPGDVGIPSTLTVRATYGSSNDISEIETFNVPAANLEITPATVVPGADLTLSATGFTLYESNIEVKIGSLSVAVPAGTNTDGEGALKDLTVKVPSLDAGVYTVQLKVGGANGTVAIGEVEVLDDDSFGEADLPEALEALGENLVRVFHFNNANKTWSFYDPRPEFAELNTLSGLSNGQSYWILVNESQNVTLNAKAQTLTCLNGECWNSIVW